VDFKTDEVRSIEQLRETIAREKYAEQVQRYVEAITDQLKQRPRASRKTRRSITFQRAMRSAKASTGLYR
jgi:ATP-dependent exoDNAse (exonuclease V) beta subunit